MGRAGSNENPENEGLLRLAGPLSIAAAIFTVVIGLILSLVLEWLATGAMLLAAGLVAILTLGAANVYLLRRLWHIVDSELPHTSSSLSHTVDLLETLLNLPDHAPVVNVETVKKFEEEASSVWVMSQSLAFEERSLKGVVFKNLKEKVHYRYVLWDEGNVRASSISRMDEMEKAGLDTGLVEFRFAPPNSFVASMAVYDPETGVQRAVLWAPGTEEFEGPKYEVGFLITDKIPIDYLVGFYTRLWDDAARL